MLCTPISTAILLATAVIGAELSETAPAKEPAESRPADGAAPAEAAVLAEYNARRAKVRDTAGAHYSLGLWCERMGLRGEATAEFAAALSFDLGHEGSWKHLGFKRHQGRWMTRDQISNLEQEEQAQRKADREWEPRLRMWKFRLAARANRADLEVAIPDVTDARAVRSIWKVFATGSADDERYAVRLLGQIEGPAPSRALALLAVSGASPEVRRAAIETLRWRDPLEFADVLIGLLREPVKYQVHPVKGPGMPGSLTIKGSAVNVERLYSPPAPPDLGVSPGELAAANARAGLPTIVRHTDETDLPFAWLYMGYLFPSGAIIPPHVPVPIQLGAMWVENWKAAHSAQRQLSDDVAAIEFENDLQRAANAQVVDVLSRCIGQRLPVDRDACRRWWFTKLGQTLISRPEQSRPTVTGFVRLDYLPRNVGGLGFDPDIGYYLIAPSGR